MKNRRGPATVSGDESRINATGKLGRRRLEEDPQVRILRPGLLVSGLNRKTFDGKGDKAMRSFAPAVVPAFFYGKIQ